MKALFGRIGVAAFLTLAVAFVATGSVRANIQDLQFQIAQQTDEPIHVTGGWFVISANTTTLVTCVSFRNEAAKTVTAVKFGFTASDAFGEGVQEITGQRVGQFTQGVSIDGPPTFKPCAYEAFCGSSSPNCWSYLSSIFQVPLANISVLMVHVDAIKYADGTIWRRPADQKLVGVDVAPKK